MFRFFVTKSPVRRVPKWWGITRDRGGPRNRVYGEIGCKDKLGLAQLIGIAPELFLTKFGKKFLVFRVSQNKLALIKMVI